MTKSAVFYFISFEILLKEMSGMKIAKSIHLILS